MGLARAKAATSELPWLGWNLPLDQLYNQLQSNNWPSFLFLSLSSPLAISLCSLLSLSPLFPFLSFPSLLLLSLSLSGHPIVFRLFSPPTLSPVGRFILQIGGEKFRDQDVQRKRMARREGGADRRAGFCLASPCEKLALLVTFGGTINWVRCGLFFGVCQKLPWAVSYPQGPLTDFFWTAHRPPISLPWQYLTIKNLSVHLLNNFCPEISQL